MILKIPIYRAISDKQTRITPVITAIKTQDKRKLKWVLNLTKQSVKYGLKRVVFRDAGKVFGVQTAKIIDSQWNKLFLIN